MQRRKRQVPKRNPIAKAVKQLRPQVIPNRRRKKLDALKKREAEVERKEES